MKKINIPLIAVVIILFLVISTYMAAMQQAEALTLYTFVSGTNKVTVPNLQTRSATAFCPKGSVVTGGGHITWDGNLLIVMNRPTQSQDQSVEGWVVEAHAPQGTGPGIFSALAQCARIQP